MVFFAKGADCWPLFNSHRENAKKRRKTAGPTCLQLTNRNQICHAVNGKTSDVEGGLIVVLQKIMVRAFFVAGVALSSAAFGLQEGIFWWLENYTSLDPEEVAMQTWTTLDSLRIINAAPGQVQEISQFLVRPLLDVYAHAREARQCNRDGFLAFSSKIQGIARAIHEVFTGHDGDGPATLRTIALEMESQFLSENLG